MAARHLRTPAGQDGYTSNMTSSKSVRLWDLIGIIQPVEKSQRQSLTGLALGKNGGTAVHGTSSKMDYTITTIL